MVYCCHQNANYITVADTEGSDGEVLAKLSANLIKAATKLPLLVGKLITCPKHLTSSSRKLVGLTRI